MRAAAANPAATRRCLAASMNGATFREGAGQVSQSIDDPWREALCSQGADGLVDDLLDVDAGDYFRSDAIAERGLDRRVFDDRTDGGHEPLGVRDLVVRPDGEH